MPLRDLIASPGHIIMGRLAKGSRIDRDVHAMLIREIDRAVAAEREACAKIAAENTDFRMPQDFGMQSMCDQLCTNIAAAIRART